MKQIDKLLRKLGLPARDADEYDIPVKVEARAARRRSIKMAHGKDFGFSGGKSGRRVHDVDCKLSRRQKLETALLDDLQQQCDDVDPGEPHHTALTSEPPVDQAVQFRSERCTVSIFMHAGSAVAATARTIRSKPSRH